MNAMVTPNSSPQKMPPANQAAAGGGMPPAGQGQHPQMGGNMAPPPLKAVQPPAGNNPGPGSSGFDSFNDLLN